GSRLPSGLSTNLEAADTARTGGASWTTSFFGEKVGSTNTKLLAVFFATSVLAAPAVAFANAGVIAVALATATPVSSFKVSLPSGPGTSSYLQSRSRSTTTRVVLLESVPIRPPL